MSENAEKQANSNSPLSYNVKGALSIPFLLDQLWSPRTNT